MSKDEDTQEVNIDELVKIRERPRTNDKFALVSFDGYAITERGDKVKTKWFENIDTTSNSYRDILLTPLEAKRLVQAHRYIKVGASMQGLMTCFGPSICKRARTCEYCILQEELDMAGDTRRVVPVGKTCPLEKDLFVDTLQKLAEEFDVGPDQYSDQRSILELAEVEVMEARANAIIASDPDLQAFTEEKLMSSTKTKDGDVVDHYVKDVADLMKVKAQLSARKDKIRKELLGTRREKEIMKARIGQHENDPSVLMSDLNLTLRQMKTAAGIAESNKSKVIDVKPE